MLCFMSSKAPKVVIRHIIYDVIGVDDLMTALGVGPKAISKAVNTGQMTASWIPVVREMYQERCDEDHPWDVEWERVLFSTRVRRRSCGTNAPPMEHSAHVR